MNISKTTTNFAKRRGIDLEVVEGAADENISLLTFWDADDDASGEWMFSYMINYNGSFTFHGNIYLSNAVKEELPAFIKNESHLRQVIAFVAENKKDWFKR